MKFYVRSRLLIQNDQIQHFIPVVLSKTEFCGVQKKKGILVFSKSGVFHIWYFVYSVVKDKIL